MTVVHACPPPGAYRTPCCLRSPLELHGENLTTDPSLVTCDPIARALGDLPPLREPRVVPAWPDPPPALGPQSWCVKLLDDEMEALAWLVAHNRTAVPAGMGGAVARLAAKANEVRR